MCIRDRLQANGAQAAARLPSSRLAPHLLRIIRSGRRFDPFLVWPPRAGNGVQWLQSAAAGRRRWSQRGLQLAPRLLRPEQP
eukprot:113328-Alexandrium_andersonii.AAC.1